jgi:hypothetical protein
LTQQANNNRVHLLSELKQHVHSTVKLTNFFLWIAHTQQAARYNAAYAALEHDAKGLRERTQQLDNALRQGKDRVSTPYVYSLTLFILFV